MRIGELSALHTLCIQSCPAMLLSSPRKLQPAGQEARGAVRTKGGGCGCHMQSAFAWPRHGQRKERHYVFPAL